MPTLVERVHALAVKCAEQDAELKKLLSEINVDTLEKPYTTYIPKYSDIDIAKLQDGAIIQTDEPIGDSEAVLAPIEHSLSGSRNTVPSSYAIKEALSAAKRNVGEIFYSLLPVEDAGVHLLDGSKFSGTGVYESFYNYLVNLYGKVEEKTNARIIGNLADNDGVISGTFDGDNYLILTPFFPESKPWEIKFSFKLDVVTSVHATLLMNYPQSSGIQLDVESGKLRIYLSSANVDNAWDLASGTLGKTTLSVNTQYWVKYVFDGSSYVVYLSTTGAFEGEETTEITVTTTAHIKGGMLNVGKHSLSEDGMVTSQTFSGSVYLADSHIKVGGDYIWKGRVKPAFVSESEWHGSVAAFGVCGKFVLDTENKTFRLPKLTGLVEGTVDTEALGELVNAGLPNIKGYLGGARLGDTGSKATSTPKAQYHSSISEGALSTSTVHAIGKMMIGTASGGTSYTTYINGILFSASQSNPIYGNSSTVQPQTIKAYIYIVLANSTKTDIQIDIDNVMNDLDTKADVDLGNVTSAGQVRMAHAAMPSDRYISLSKPSGNSTVIAPADGYYLLVFQNTSGSSGATAGYTALIASRAQVRSFNPVGGSIGADILLPVSKGDVVTIGDIVRATITRFEFIYANGSIPA